MYEAFESSASWCFILLQGGSSRLALSFIFIISVLHSLLSRTMDLHLRKQTRDHGFLGKNLKTLVKNHRLQWFDSHIVENHWLTYSQEPLIYIWSRIVDSHKVEVQRILFSQDSSTLYNQASLALMCRQVIAQIVCAMINVLRLWKGQCFLCFVVHIPS